MNKTVQACLLGLVLLSLATLSLQSIPALAATPTPTLRPIPPSATSSYLYLRPTPTPLTINPVSMSVTFAPDNGGLADWSINMYRFANRDHVLDFIGTGLLVFACVAALIKVAGRTTKND